MTYLVQIEQCVFHFELSDCFLRRSLRLSVRKGKYLNEKVVNIHRMGVTLAWRACDESNTGRNLGISPIRYSCHETTIWVTPYLPDIHRRLCEL